MARTPTGDPEVGGRIRDARTRAGLTQLQLVEQLPSAPEGRDHRWMSNIEAGFSDLKAHDLREICEALGLSADWLLFGREPDVRSSSLSRDESLLLRAWRLAAPPARRLLRASALAIAEDAQQYDAREEPPRRRRRGSA